MNLNLNLNTDLSSLIKPLAQRLGLIITISLIAIIGYTAYFVGDLFFAKDDLDALSQYQDTSQTKQIRFNQATLESLDKLVPETTSEEPTTTRTGRSNPFAPF